jgi:hypothetical protein
MGSKQSSKTKQGQTTTTTTATTTTTQVTLATSDAMISFSRDTSPLMAALKMFIVQSSVAPPPSCSPPFYSPDRQDARALTAQGYAAFQQWLRRLHEDGINLAQREDR